jgi:hypothetical protein
VTTIRRRGTARMALIREALVLASPCLQHLLAGLVARQRFEQSARQAAGQPCLVIR